MIDAYVFVLSICDPLLMEYTVRCSSHGNSEKKHEKQVGVIEDVVKQLGNIDTAANIMGVMIESHLVAGQSFRTSFPLSLACILRSVYGLMTRG